jgi:hypothetical protein
MRGIQVKPHDIRAGNAAMYFPEANVLVPPVTDPDSKTPAFKSVLVAVEAEAALNGGDPRVANDLVVARVS